MVGQVSESLTTSEDYCRDLISVGPKQVAFTGHSHLSGAQEQDCRLSSALTCQLSANWLLMGLLQLSPAQSKKWHSCSCGDAQRSASTSQFPSSRNVFDLQKCIISFQSEIAYESSQNKIPSTYFKDVNWGVYSWLCTVHSRTQRFQWIIIN